MGRFNKKSGGSNRNSSLIKSGSNSDALENLTCFSLKFYDKKNKNFQCTDRDGKYFQALLDRMKDLSYHSVAKLTKQKPDSTLRFHRIDFKDHAVSEKGFGIARGEEYDLDAWQFSISANEHGRVHGSLIGNVFHLVWLDPDHNLYP